MILERYFVAVQMSNSGFNRNRCGGDVFRELVRTKRSDVGGFCVLNATNMLPVNENNEFELQLTPVQ